MASTEEVCKAFFNIEHTLNKGHGIITSIYSLIRRTKDREEYYFKSVNDRIERASSGCKTLENYEQLLKTCWLNMDNFFRPKWVRIAYVFYVTEKIDSIARHNLPYLTYLGFKDIAEVALYDHLKMKFGSTLSTHDWDMMYVAEEMNQNEPKLMPLKTMVTLFAITYAVIDIYNKL